MAAIASARIAPRSWLPTAQSRCPRAGIDKVKLTIKGVRAEVLLKVRLDNVNSIIDRTLTTIDRNPQILERLLTTVDNTVGTVGGIANTALQPGGVLSQTVNTLGQTVQRTLDT